MINELLSKVKDVFSSERTVTNTGYHSTYVRQIKTDLRLLHPKHYEASYNPRCQHQMEAFFIDYFCKDFETAERVYTPEHYHHALFQDLKSPTYRASLTQQLPQAISRLLHASKHSLNNEESSRSLLLSPHIKHQALSIANSAPFSQSRLFEDFNDIKTHMGHTEFLAVICSALLKQHCITNNTSILEKRLFEDGLRNAYICLCLAQKNQQDGISAFISGFMHFISLIYLHRELLAYEIAPCRSALFEEITHFLPKFNYWLAKDWGLPENLLIALRERFLDSNQLTGLSGIMQTADHTNLALMLFQEKLMTAKQTRQFIHVIGLDDFNLMEQLFSLEHEPL